MRFAILLITCFCVFVSMAQNEKVLQIKLYEKELDISVKHAQLILQTENARMQSVSNLEGLAYFNIDDMIKIQTLKIENNHFNDTLFELRTEDFKRIDDDTLFLQVNLTFSGDLQEGVDVFSSRLPDTIFSSERISVADFELMGNNRILLLTYEKRLKKSSQISLLEDGEIKSTVNVPGRAEKLFSDFRGNIHIQCKKSIYSVFVDGYDVLKLGALDKDYFFKYVVPIVDTSQSKFYFSNYSPDYPAVDYMCVDQIDTTYQHLLNIEDELMMELYTSEYKWVDVRTKLWAMHMEQDTGIDKRIWVGANYFTQSIYYEEIYAPMFMRNDSLFIFDHYKELMFVLDREGERLDSIPIYYHMNERKTGWSKLLVQDETTGQIYSVYEKAGFKYLRRINTRTGESELVQRLHFRYVDKLEIRANKVYYIYRPFESRQKKYLYEEKLYVNYPDASVLNGDPLKGEGL